MKAIISRETESGAMAEVGTTNRTVVSHYKTVADIRRFAEKYAAGKRFRIEIFTDNNFYGEPFHVEHS